MLRGQRNAGAGGGNAAHINVGAIHAVGDEAKQAGGGRVERAAEHLAHGDDGRSSVGHSQPAAHSCVAWVVRQVRGVCSVGDAACEQTW